MDTKTEKEGKDPFLCSCGPCKRFWRSTFGPEAGRLKRSPACQSPPQRNLVTHKSPQINIGKRVIVKDKHPGTVKYIGHLDTVPHSVCPKIYVGVKLDDNVNSVHNGIYQGKRYFFCPKGHGAMVNPTHVRPASAPVKKPSLTGNPMFPSYEVIRKRRRERIDKLASLDESSICSSSVVGFPGLNRNHSSLPRNNKDTKDMMYQDRQRELEKEHRRIQQRLDESQRPKPRPPSQLQKWKAEFGGDERAARMAQTLQKLHLAYEEGRKLVGEIVDN